MNIEQLEYIVDIAKTGSISATAENMHISQAGISKAVVKFESELGFELFTRGRMGTIPTERGRTIIEKATEVLRKIQEIKDEMQVQDFVDTIVRLSVSPNFTAVLPKAIVSFKHEYPNVRLEIVEKDSEDIIEDIKQNKTDMGLIYFHNDQSDAMKGLSVTSLIESRTVVCASKNSWLATKTSITPKEIISESFVNMNGSYSNPYMKKFKDKYGRVNVIFTSNNLEVLKRTIAEEEAIGLFIEFSLKKDPLLVNGDIVLVPLVGDEEHVVKLGCARSKKEHFSKAHSDLLKHVTREISLLS
ncbi:LysR family transcriptional regulator [Brevibacillus fluminis]|nr:LysR family transcriptional regulator [Brevibacillus fluminis]